MFKKILVAEDQQSISAGLKSTLTKLDIPLIETVDYCDNALLKLKAALLKNVPFDLLITDLSFKEDHRLRKLRSGEDLIEQVKKIQPDLNVIVFSIENRIGIVKKLIDVYGINGYISKGRRESEDLSKAIKAILRGVPYFSEDIVALLHNAGNISEVSTSDKLILELLAKGLNQKQISEHFKKNNIPSGSKRSIEYRLQDLKILFDADTLPHLISIVKDVGLI
ncbi:response regulator [uncultured Aquimarina sp.]|uniref:response regulator n=1 Tax=uncultured Aquimarina sp. TaxID=575652 RepID=UPI00262750BA|nr:response regulator [uncultured Aquimarina sp.]